MRAGGLLLDAYSNMSTIVGRERNFFSDFRTQCQIELEITFIGSKKQLQSADWMHIVRMCDGLKTRQSEGQANLKSWSIASSCGPVDLPSYPSQDMGQRRRLSAPVLPSAYNF